ncbi:MAG: hypothetical protein KAS32_28190 [Candidatus Peribacteraceae bacterium]|nr:hypothetical protein [Candidatus Peribacteraceae bacterium]
MIKHVIVKGFREIEGDCFWGYNSDEKLVIGHYIFRGDKVIVYESMVWNHEGNVPPIDASLIINKLVNSDIIVLSEKAVDDSWIHQKKVVQND